MKIIAWNEILNCYTNNQIHPLFLNKESGISVGSFDGVHKGHQCLLTTLVSDCEASQNKSASNKSLAGVLTFSRPLPSLKKSADYQGDVCTLNQKLQLLEDFKIDFVILVDFNPQFSQFSGTDFFNILLQTINLKTIVEGVDFRCGYKGATDCKLLKQWAMENHVNSFFIEPVFCKLQEQSLNSTFSPNSENCICETAQAEEGCEQSTEKLRISSSVIRQFIKKGNLDFVQKLLGHSYELDLSEINANILKSCAERKSSLGNDSMIVIETKNIIQVLPPRGVYKDLSVKINFDQNIKKNLKNPTVTIQDDFLFLDFSSLID